MPVHPHPPQKSPANDQQLLNKQEVARLLATTLSHVDRLIEEGHLGFVKVGRFIRLTPDDLDQYLRQAHVAPRDDRR